jgi:CDP-glucose 4,6-dehydratase
MTSKVLKGLNVLVTGHTGFKGSWLILMLQSLGARVNGFSLPPEKNSIFSSIPYDGTLDSRFGDIRNFVSLNTNATNLECIQNYVPLTAKNEDELNYFLDHRICLSNLISDS